MWGMRFPPKLIDPQEEEDLKNRDESCQREGLWQEGTSAQAPFRDEEIGFEGIGSPPLNEG
jgi:hypothetical protein